MNLKTRQHRRCRRAQMEILGLAIVVIILTLVMVFVIKFVLLKKPAEFKQEFTQTQLASNMVHTLLKTTATGCKEISFTELFQDCAEGSTIDCNGRTSCSFIKEETRKIFSSTLDKWGVGYEFTAFLKNQEPFIKIGEPCDGEKKTKPFPIPGIVTFYVKLDICG